MGDKERERGGAREGDRHSILTENAIVILTGLTGKYKDMWLSLDIKAQVM